MLSKYFEQTQNFGCLGIENLVVIVGKQASYFRNTERHSSLHITRAWQWLKRIIIVRLQF